MSGSTSRSGFGFQDLVLAERVLAHVISLRAAAASGETVPKLQFGVEAAPVAGATPEWDTIQADHAGVLTLEEAKSGAVEADDRWALWRRVRRTLAHLPPANVREVRVLLTVNAESLPANPEFWRTLAVESQTASGAWVTPAKDQRRKSVRTAVDLANEALHVLTSDDADTSTSSTALSLDRARAVLARFSFNEQHSADSVEDKVRCQLEMLSRGIGVRELLAALQGEIFRRAASKDHSERNFEAADILASLSVLEKLAAVEPDTSRCYHELRTTATANELDLAAEGGGLEYQDWRPLQPRASNALRPSRCNSVALLGRGGLGKTVVLRRWLSERRETGDEAWFLAATDVLALAPEQLTSALDLGAFAARHSGRQLVVGVDAVENSAERRGHILAALRAAVAHGISVCITCRLVDWRSARGTAEAVAGWEAVELEEWPEDRVRCQVDASGRPRIATDLLHLLKTPLLLDLFVRTFGRDADVPPGLQTRHGLLQAYWDRRILPAGDERSAERRAALMTITQDEARGVLTHTITGPAPRDLTSEGLLSLSLGGTRSFRHSLLRDFAMMIWARDGAVSPEDISGKLGLIQPSLLQFGSLRATLEALSAERQNGMDLLRALEPPLLFHAATVIGEFEELSSIELPSIIDSLRTMHRSGFVTALLSAIRLDRNIGWAIMLTRLSDDAACAHAEDWLTADTFRQLVETFEAMADVLVTHEGLSVQVASRLRVWSLSNRVVNEDSGNGGYGLGRLAKLLCTLDPGPNTVSWLGKTVGLGSWTKFWILSELPGLVRTMVERNCPIDDDSLQLIYRVAAGLRDDAGRLRDDLNVARDAMTAYDRIEQSLIGRAGGAGEAGLISSRPTAFVPVAIDLLAGYEADEADAREQRHREFNALLPPDLNWVPEFSAEVSEIKTRAEAAANAAQTGIDDELDGTFIVDTPTDPYWDIDAEYAQLLDHLRGLAEQSLGGDHGFFDEVFCPSVLRSRSAIAHACLLDLLTRHLGPPNDMTLDVLLKDTRLYFLSCARPYLQRAIRIRWQNLPEPDRELVLTNIRRSGRGASGNVYNPGPFLAAIPVAQRPDDMQVFVDLYQVSGLELEIEEAPRHSVVPVERVPVAVDAWVPIAGLSEVHQGPWQFLSKSERGQMAQATDEDWSAIVGAVHALIASDLPAPDALLGRAALIERLGEFFTLSARGDHQRRPSGLDTQSLATIARWAIDATSRFPAADIIAGCGPFDGSSVGLPPTAELWMSFVELADSVLWDSELCDDPDLNRRLFSAIDSIGHDPPARLSWNLLAGVRGWFRCGGIGKPILWQLLAERVRHARALTKGLGFLESFSSAEQQALIRIWLVTELSPEISPPRTFASAAGQHLGWAAMMRYSTGEATGSHELVKSLIRAPSASGLLHDPQAHALFVGQTVFGAKQAVENGGVPLARASEYVEHMEACWTALLPSLVEGARKDGPAFALWAFHPVLDAAKANSDKLRLTSHERLAWWRKLLPLAIAIARGGPSREVNSLFRCLQRSPLLAEVDASEVVDVVEALGSRTASLVRESLGPHWQDAIACASSVVEALVARAADTRVRDRLYTLVATWAAPPLALECAGLVAKKIRR